MNGRANVRELPQRLDELLEDRRCGLVRHHLRRLYLDPITRSPNWGLVTEFGRIRGVYSQSPLEPVRHLEGIHSYRQWVFLAYSVGHSDNQPGTSSCWRCEPDKL